MQLPVRSWVTCEVPLVQDSLGCPGSHSSGPLQIHAGMWLTVQVLGSVRGSLGSVEAVLQASTAPRLKMAWILCWRHACP